MNHETTNMRQYKYRINDCGDLFTAEQWENEVKNQICYNDHGQGYWVKDNLESEDEVFSSERQDATHVIWYNK